MENSWFGSINIKKKLKKNILVGRLKTEDRRLKSDVGSRKSEVDSYKINDMYNRN